MRWALNRPRRFAPGLRSVCATHYPNHQRADVAIEYLLPQHTGRMQFDAPRSRTIDGVAVPTFRFREVRGPSIVRDPGGADLLAEGRVWAGRASGEIVRTELILRDRHSSGTSVVDFRVDPRLSIRVPVKMTGRYVCGAKLSTPSRPIATSEDSPFRQREKLTKPPQ